MKPRYECEADGALLAATAAGDGEAFAAFFRRHERVVVRFAVRRCTSAQDVADTVAETFLAALGKAGDYRAETNDAVPWLLGIAVRVMHRQQRARSRRLARELRVSRALPLYERAEADAVIAAIDAQRRAPELDAALARLPRRERAVLELVALDGLSPTEAAQALGLSPNAARLRLARARRRMRAALGSDTDATFVELEPEIAHA